jgi:hypothetical protein
MALSAAATDVICNNADEPDLTVKINEVLVDEGTPGTMMSKTDQQCVTNAEELNLTGKNNEVLVDEGTPGTMMSKTDQQCVTNAEEPDLTGKNNEVLVDEGTPDIMSLKTIISTSTADQQSSTTVDEPDLTAKINEVLLDEATPDMMTLVKTPTDQQSGTNADEPDLTAKKNEVLLNKDTPDTTTLIKTPTDQPCGTNGEELDLTVRKKNNNEVLVVTLNGTEQQYETNANNPFVTRCLRVSTINDGAQTKLRVVLCGIRWQVVDALGTIMSLLQRHDSIPVTTTNQHGVDELPVMMELQVETNNDDTIHLEVNLCGSRRQLFRSLGATISLIQKLT